MAAAGFWRSLMRKVDVRLLWALIWPGALLVPFLPWPWLAGLTLAAWASAAAVAPARPHGSRMICLAIGFFIFWGLMMALLNFGSPAFFRPWANLAAWLALGLNLMLAKTPLELALPTGRMLAPVIGRMRAQKLALALALLARLIPRLVSSAFKIKTSLDRRAGRLPLIRRLSLWGRAIVREAMSGNDELARALLKRWPWNG